MEENRNLTQRSTTTTATNGQKDFGYPTTIEIVFAEYPHPDPPDPPDHPDPPNAPSATFSFWAAETATASPDKSWGGGKQCGATPLGQAKSSTNV